DQEHGVGAGRPRLVQLVLIDDEVLAQDRQSARPAGEAQILERAIEMRRLGQHRQRTRAATLVRAYDFGDLGARAQRAGGGRAALPSASASRAACTPAAIESALPAA